MNAVTSAVEIAAHAAVLSDALLERGYEVIDLPLPESTLSKVLPTIYVPEQNDTDAMVMLVTRSVTDSDLRPDSWPQLSRAWPCFAGLPASARGDFQQRSSHVHITVGCVHASADKTIRIDACPRWSELQFFSGSPALSRVWVTLPRRVEHGLESDNNTIHFGPEMVAPGARHRFPGYVPGFHGRRLIIPSIFGAHFAITDIVVNRRSRLGVVDDVPAVVFHEMSVGVNLSLPVIEIGGEIVIEVHNRSDEPRSFQAALIGYAPPAALVGEVMHKRRLHTRELRDALAAAGLGQWVSGHRSLNMGLAR